MKRKRLTREGWGFDRFPYYQMRVDLPEFHGTAGLLRIVSGSDDFCWHMPKAGKVSVSNRGMTWLQLAPEDQHRLITVMYRRPGIPGKLPRVSVWYVDVIDRVETDPDGVLAFVDMYLDVIFTPQGDVHIDDREELDAAHASGELSETQHALAVTEGDNIVQTMCSDLRAAEKWCGTILRHVLSRLEDGDTLRRNV